jgi:pilus assembly protein CpaE
VAVHHEADARIDREALKAGAQGFFAPPIDVERLKAKVFGVAANADPNRLPGALLAFVPARGGDGASTLALHVAQALSQIGGGLDPEGAATLFVDFDFHAGASAFRLKLQQGATVLDALRLGDDVESRWRGLPTRWKALDLLVAPDSEASPDADLFQAIPDLVDFLRRSYRYIVLDLPPAFYSSARDVLRLTDRVFVVHTPEVVSRAHADRRVQDILGLGLEPSRISAILNRADSKTPRTVESVFTGQGVQQFAQVRNDYAVLRDAEMAGHLASEKTGLGQDIYALAEAIVAVS